MDNQMAGTSSLFNFKPNDHCPCCPSYRIQNNNQNDSSHYEDLMPLALLAVYIHVFIFSHSVASLWPVSSPSRRWQKPFRILLVNSTVVEKSFLYLSSLFILYF